MPFDVHKLYQETCRYYALLPPPAFIATLFINAPFGRFSWKKGGLLGLLQVDGIKSWIFMELFAPLTFIYALLQAPFASRVYSPSTASKLMSKLSILTKQSTEDFSLVPSLSTLSSLSPQQKILASLFLIHYANRAIISPLRTPSRSPSNLIVVLCAVVFNIVNGSLMGSYISSDACQAHIQDSSVRYWFGYSLWAAGFVGNVIHDEILLNIRRRQQSAASKKSTENGKKEHHYAIPHGLLYTYVSYPNYLCEWIEWTGFAIAAAPFPLLLTPNATRLFSPFTPHAHLLQSLTTDVLEVLDAYTRAAPPWLFIFAEVFTMASRAWRGHQWYKTKFPEYPKERTAVVPFLF